VPLQSIVDVTQGDTEAGAEPHLEHAGQVLRGYPHTVIGDSHAHVAVGPPGSDGHRERTLLADTMLHAVLHDRLQYERWDRGGQHLGIEVRHHAQPVTEPRLLEPEVRESVLDLPFEGDEPLVVLQHPPGRRRRTHGGVRAPLPDRCGSSWRSC